MFDLVSLLAKESTQLSTGNMAAQNVEFGPAEAMFNRIPFDLVYHRGTTSGHPHAGTIPFHRHAEVLVPQSLSTAEIKRIVCRSHPERRMLLHQLNPAVRARVENIIHVEATDFFERRWAFVEKVEPGFRALTFSFHPPDALSTPLNVSFKYHDTNQIWTWRHPWQLRTSLTLDLSKARQTGMAMLWIEESLAFQDKVNLSEGPL